ncbi:MAG: hypothetical protein ACOX1S_06545 [Anaerostipes sp.]
MKLIDIRTETEAYSEQEYLIKEIWGSTFGSEEGMHQRLICVKI